MGYAILHASRSAETGFKWLFVTDLEHRHAVDGFRESKVRNFDDGRNISCEKYILRLEVTVRDPLAVDVL